MTLVCKDGKFAGRITANHKIYEVRSISKDKHFLVELNAANFAIDDGANENPDIEPVVKPKLKSTMTEDPVLIKILILYTDSCNMYYDRDMGPWIDLAMDELQDALTESLSNLTVGVCLADSAETTHSESYYGIEEDKDWLDSDSNVAALRDATHADLVVLLTHGWRNERGTSWPGPNANTAFCVARAPYITATASFTHEVGHLFGCKHQRYGYQDGGINHGFRFEEWDGTHSTIMHTVYSWEESQRLFRFSNPNKIYIEFPMGDVNYANNALWIEQHASTVADFRIDPTPNYLMAFISGPTHGMPNVNYTWQADYTGGTGPYACTWYKYYQNDYIPVGTGWSYTAPLPTTGSMFYLKVIVTSGDNQEYAAFYAVAIDQYEPTIEVTHNHNQNQLAAGYNKSNLEIDVSLSSTITIFPNPLTEVTVIQYLVKQASQVEIKLSDLSGRTLFTFEEGSKEAGTYSKRLSTSRLNPGIYLCSVRIGDTNTIKKLVIQ